MDSLHTSTPKEQRILQLQQEIDGWNKIAMLPVKDRRLGYSIESGFPSPEQTGSHTQIVRYKTRSGEAPYWKIITENVAFDQSGQPAYTMDPEDRLKIIKELTLSQDIEQIRQDNPVTDFLTQNWNEIALQFPHLSPTTARLPSFTHVNMGGRHFDFIGLLPDDSLVVVPEQKIGDKVMREYDTLGLQNEIFNLAHIRPHIHPLTMTHLLNSDRVHGIQGPVKTHTLMVLAQQAKK